MGGGGDDSCFNRKRYNNKTNDHKLDELLEEETILSYWLDADNHELPYTPLHIDHTEVCATIATAYLEPSNVETEGWMRNYGNTADYWYIGGRQLSCGIKTLNLH